MSLTADQGAAMQPDFVLHRLDCGFELRRGAIVMRVAALRDDILRVRIGRAGALPEDASWAVLPEARVAGVAVQAEPTGMATGRLRARVDLGCGALTVSDLDGRVILDDASATPLREDGDGFRITKTLPAQTHIFGLGEKAGDLERRGRSFTMWNTDAYRYQESSDPLYKSIPFYVGFEQGRAYGLFLDNSFRTSFEFGVLHPDRLSFGADGGAVDYYILAGPTPKDVQRAYAWLTGPPPLPPLWSFGFQLSRYSYMSAAEIRTVAARLRRERLPCDVLWFDIDVLDRNRAFTIDPQSYADFPGLLADLRQQQFRSVVIADLHLSSETGDAYAPYDSGLAGDHFVKAADGAAFVGTVWPGPCVFPDFTRAATRAWWGTLFETQLLVDQVDGIWNDMNEPSVFMTPSRTMPLDAVHRIEEPGFATRTASHAEIHNVFGMQNARATHDGMLRLRCDRRPFVMSRATYAGGHRTCVVWTGDNSAGWNHLRMSTPMLLSLGLGGFAFAGCDLGGFSGSPPADLLTRWLQLGMFNPISRDHSDKGTRHQEPWVDGERHTAIRRRFIEERYRLMPYIYTLAEASSRTGLAMMRPLFMEFPDAAGGYPLDLEAGNQFMWGDALLVAPAPYPEAMDRYQVLLPAGDWFDYWTGAKLADLPPGKLTGGSGMTAEPGSATPAMPRAVLVMPELEHLPIFVRAGSIVPRQPLVQSTAETPRGALEIAVYPGPDCNGSVYLDDGVSLAYRRGAFLRTGFACETAIDGSLSIEIGTREGSFDPWWETLELVVHDVAPGAVARIGATQAAPQEYDRARRILRVRVPESAHGCILTIAAG